MTGLILSVAEDLAQQDRRIKKEEGRRKKIRIGLFSLPRLVLAGDDCFMGSFCGSPWLDLAGSPWRVSLPGGCVGSSQWSGSEA